MNFLRLLVDGDGVTRLVAVVLFLMSCSSWVVILWKGWLLHRAGTDVARSTAAFWQSADLADGQRKARALALVGYEDEDD